MKIEMKISLAQIFQYEIFNIFFFFVEILLAQITQIQKTRL